MTASSSEAPRADRTPIRDLAAGDDVDQTFLVTESSVGEAKNGNPFVRLTLVDRSGELSAIRFDSDDAPEPGVYRVEGAIEEFNGLQCKVKSVMPSVGDPSEFVRASHMTHDELSERMYAAIQKIDGEFGRVVDSIFCDEQLFQTFLAAPASRTNHHAYERGLAEHTLSMLELADAIVDHYAEFYTDDIDRDLVLAGVLLHDLGKATDFVRDGFAWKVGIDGELVGHIPEVATLIHDACMATLAADDTRRRLLHVVLAHHGELEWGSPVRPKLVEAQIVHQVDMIDSRLAMHREATRTLEHNEVSGWVRPLGGRVVR